RRAVNRAGRKAGAVEQHLRRNQDGARFLGLWARKVKAVDGGKGQFTRPCRASQNSGGEHEKRKSEPRDRPGMGWIARVVRHDKNHWFLSPAVPSRCILGAPTEVPADADPSRVLVLGAVSRRKICVIMGFPKSNA